MREGRRYIGETKKKEITFMLLKWERERERERERWIWVIICINKRRWTLNEDKEK